MHYIEEAADVETSETQAATAPTAPECNVEIECYHLASVQGPDGTRHHIVVDPTSRTLEAVRKWKDSRSARGITVTDRAGLHSRDVKARVIDTVFSFGTLLITTTK